MKLKYIVFLFVLVIFSFGINIIQFKEINSMRGINIDLESQIKSMRMSTESGGGEVKVSDIKNNLSTNFIFPIHEEDFKYFTSPYGIRVSPFLNVEMKHTGVDIASTWRAQVVSIADGIVIEHYPIPGTSYSGGGTYRGHDVYGGMIKIDHGDFISLYAHLSYSRVHTGDKIIKGNIIGRVGGTGKSKGEHLHFELINKNTGETVNPLLYLENIKE